MSEHTVLPLLNSAFEPGKALEAVERIEDVDFRCIARAELFYFTGGARECSEIVESYLTDERLELRLVCFMGMRILVLEMRGLRGGRWRRFRSVCAGL